MIIFNNFPVSIRYLHFHFFFFVIEMVVFTCHTISLKGFLLI